MHPFENYPHGGDEPLGPTRDVDDVAVYTDHSCAFCGLRIDKSNPGLATGVLHYVVARKQRSIQWAAGFQRFFGDKINAVRLVNVATATSTGVHYTRLRSNLTNIRRASGNCWPFATGCTSRKGVRFNARTDRSAIMVWIDERLCSRRSTR